MRGSPVPSRHFGTRRCAEPLEERALLSLNLGFAHTLATAATTVAERSPPIRRETSMSPATFREPSISIRGWGGQPAGFVSGGRLCRQVHFDRDAWPGPANWAEKVLAWDAVRPLPRRCRRECLHHRHVLRDADFDPSPTGTHNLTSSSIISDVFVSKLDTNGNFVWAGRMGGFSPAEGNGSRSMPAATCTLPDPLMGRRTSAGARRPSMCRPISLPTRL